jgi:hypothetical protein
MAHILKSIVSDVNLLRNPGESWNVQLTADLNQFNQHVQLQTGTTNENVVY